MKFISDTLRGERVVELIEQLPEFFGKPRPMRSNVFPERRARGPRPQVGRP